MSNIPTRDHPWRRRHFAARGSKPLPSGYMAAHEALYGGAPVSPEKPKAVSEKALSQPRKPL